MDLLTAFRQYIQEERLIQPGDKLLLAVSGGVDSVVLAELCHRCGYSFVIAHCNFQLRGTESERDEHSVQGLGEKYGVPVLVKRFDTNRYAEEQKVSVQVAARELRYAWFREITPNLILTAHHQDDNVETLLMNFFKGTGIAGLRGILPRQDSLVRPLLFAWKEDILLFAREAGLVWVEDSSNLSDKYTRNFFRHQLIPLVEQAYPGALSNLAANTGRFRETEQLYREAVEMHKKKLLEFRGQEVHIPVLKLKKARPLATLVYEIIHPYGFSPGQVEDVIGLLDSPSGKYVASSSHRILKNRNWLILGPLQTDSAMHILIESPDAGVPYPEGELVFSSFAADAARIAALTGGLPAPSGKAVPAGGLNAVAHLDADMIRFPLLLRRWKTGDYFYPLGMKKKKKLSRFLIDNKLSLADKEKVWVLEMDKKIIWVVGRRIDDRFRITAGTRNILKIMT